jgi:hypothetical protein
MNIYIKHLKLRDVAMATLATLFFFAFIPAMAGAADVAPTPQPSLALPAIQAVAVLIGFLSPLVTYVLNHYAPWADEKIKAVVQVVVAAVAAGLYQAIEVGSIGFNSVTLQLVSTAVFAALLTHKILWLPSGISAKLGGGTNIQDNPAR